MNELPLNQILCGDCAELLQDFPDNSIDLVVTDPPYGLRFMGKEWDQALPPRKAFKQIIRVLKPGGLAFVMSSPRQDLMWRMCALLEGVGFEMRQSFISWIYKTGFPKAYDVSKGIDHKLGVLEERKITGKYIAPRQVEKETLRDEWPTAEYAQSANKNTYGEYSGAAGRFDLTEPVSDEAKEWGGWKSQTGLKPALEPILMVNKPFSESTIVENVRRWGTGAINVDATRIPFKEEDLVRPQIKRRDNIAYGKGLGVGVQENPKGRFPANLLVSDGALDTGETTKSSSITRERTTPHAGSHGKTMGTGWDGTIIEVGYGDVGDQSRYFDLDAWVQHHGFLDVPKPDTKERDYGLKGKKGIPKSKFNLNDGSKDERFDGAVSVPRRNTHPTVKPIKLMAYLIELGCPRNGVVLDPFVGSGTTCIAAKQLGRRYIGIEINEEYHTLAEARVAAYPQPLEWFQEAQDVH